MRFLWDEQEQDYFSEEEIAEIKARRMERYASQEGKKQRDDKIQHRDGSSCGKTPEASGSDCAEHCKEVWEENP
jgi:hypothetical protein